MNDLLDTFGDILDLRDKPFVMVDKKIIEDVENFNKNELLAYVVICKFADNANRQAFPSMSTIAKYMRTSKETARVAIKGLIEKGVLVYQQRKNPENEKENISNIYAIVDQKNWSKAKIRNHKVLDNREKEYARRLENSRKKINKNKKVASAANTNNSEKKLNNNSSDENSLTHIHINTQGNNIDLITNNNIKIPKNLSKSTKEEIINWDRSLLIECIEYMNKNRLSISNFNINYLSKIYKNPIFKNEVCDINEFKTKFHNFDETFTKYTEEEFEDIILKSQKKKFG